MVAQEIPCGNQGLRSGVIAVGSSALQWLFEPKSPAKPVDLRRNGPARAKVPYLLPDRAGSVRMNPAPPRHVPVLGGEAVEMLEPRDGGIYVDATFGAGGYSRAVLDGAGTRVLGRAISPPSPARRSRCSSPAMAASMSTPLLGPAATAGRSSTSREPASSA